jgi:hypothetical protein
VDRATLALVRDYARLSGAELEEPEPHLMRLRVAAADGRFFGDKLEHLLALDANAVERYPDAELPVIGGSFWNGLVAAIRQRGDRCVDGALPVTVTTSEAIPDVPVLDAAVEVAEQGRELRRVVRLSVKLSMSAGTTVREEVVESDALDLATGRPVPPEVRDAMGVPEPHRTEFELPWAEAVPADRLFASIVRGLEERVAIREESLRHQATRDLEQELARIDRYYEALRKDVRDEAGSGSSALRTIELEHEKRRGEEELRHQVRIDVQPLQVLERTVCAERVTWAVTAPSGTKARLDAQRYLTGDGAWGLHCERCGEVPTQLVVCRGGHVVGAECAVTCTVCRARVCGEHGHESCAIDGQPMCDEDADECHACGRMYCVGHQATCEEGGHHACVECVAACAICGRATCSRHGVDTAAGAPRGTRFLCNGCAVYCEGATSEPIGIDEAATCGTCGDYVCERHQVSCVIDERPHCSRHLRRADRSRRFICEAHGATCEREPDLLFAQDEIQPCVECGVTSCNRHGAACHEDQLWHCVVHMAELTDVPGAVACRTHSIACHIDGRVYSLGGTTPCEICAGSTCRAHLSSCEWCGASVCTNDRLERRCVTCRKLEPAPDPPEEVITAAAAIPGEHKARAWHIARDGARFVVQLDLGWTRRIVFSVPHGSATAVRVLRHSMFGSSRLRGH